MSAKPGRNDPCPCGSGRKYKNCCLGTAAAAGSQSRARALYQQAARFLQRGDFASAVPLFQRALAQQPDYFEARVDLGNALNQLRRHAEALDCYRCALALRPGFMPLEMNIGACLDESGAHDEAIAYYLAVIARDPANAQLRHNLATAQRRAGRFDDAVASYRECLQRGHRDALTCLSLAGTLLQRQHYAEALQVLDEAIALHPADPDLHDSRGSVLLTLGRVGEAMAAFAQAQRVHPSGAEPASTLLARLYLDDVSEERIEGAFADFVRVFEQPLAGARLPLFNRPEPQRPLRVGYLSGDFRAHSVAYFIEPVLAAHARPAFSVHCYHTTTTRDEVTERLRALADAWFDCAELSDEQLARRIRDDGIDILVDLAGHTAGSRLLALARRPAPVQLGWLGFPAQTGLQAIDAMISDPVASPVDPGAPLAFDPALRIARLPRIFSCYRPSASAPPPDRLADADGDRIQLGSFNNAAKISDKTVRAWARVLLELGDARLTLKDKAFADPATCQWMRERFAAHGLASERLALMARTRSEHEHLELYRRIDLALDTYPYCGVTTTCEALWMGVPVISRAGDSFRSRMGATLLTAIDQPHWVAQDEDGFVQRAVRLAADAPLRAQLRQNLRARMRASPLMDEAGFARELETLYRDAWTRWCASRP